MHPVANPAANATPAAPTHGAPAGVTRLAPSPTGALHLGNVRTFLVNWVLARQRGWRVVLRIEDLDTPRVKPGVIEATIDTLAWLGLDWDQGPLVQSRDITPYDSAMAHLAHAGLVYPSALSRAAGSGANAVVGDEGASAPQEGAHEAYFGPEHRPAEMPREFVHHGASNPAHAPPDAPAWRFATPDVVVDFDDAFAGPQRHAPSRTVGDFIVWTKRGQPSYQLAVVVDDARSGITDVVRGDDLLDSAARQILLYRALGLGPAPRYWHIPLVTGQDGRRLAKRHGDTRVDAYRARGVTAERIIGLAAWWCGIGADPGQYLGRTPGLAGHRDAGRQPMTARDCVARLDVRTISRSAITFTREDHEWLLGSPTAGS